MEIFTFVFLSFFFLKEKRGLIGIGLLVAEFELSYDRID